MKQSKKLFAIASTMFLLIACQKETRNINLPEESTSARRTDINNVAGYVYTLSNQAGGNEVVVYSRTSSGFISWSSSVSTNGNGTGGGLGNQGALAMTEDGNYLLAVNPASNSIASLKINGGSLSLMSTISSGGMMPVSITQHSNLVFVLNAGGTGNISGFTIDAGGMLSPIAGSSRSLSSDMAGPAQVSFVQDGKVVVVSEKATNKIISYTVDDWGMPGTMHSMTSANPTPFGFAVGHNSNIYVTEADGGNPATSSVSAYHVNADGSIMLTMGPVFAEQTAACWAVATNNGKYVYATNTGDNTVSSFITNSSGSLSVLEAAAGHTGDGPIDAALSNNSKFLYVLNARDNTISAFAVGNDGSLDNIQAVPNVPVGATGLISK